MRNNFLTARHFSSGTAQGLLDSLNRAVQYLRLEDCITKLIGFGCDGASANMAEGGLRCLLRCKVPWIFMFWCLAHCLELSVKDTLRSTFFATINELLLHIYYLYEKAPKKCRGLDDIHMELKSSLEPLELPPQGEIRPLRVCGTLFVAFSLDNYDSRF